MIPRRRRSLLSEPPQTPVLFIFAHHDDEFFIAATIREAARRGEVRIAWLTSGGLHGARRRAESVQAARLLGVPAKNLLFLALPDHHALDFLDDIVDRLAALILRLRPAAIFVPAFEGGHLDHDTTQLAAAIALEKISGDAGQPVLYEFPLYHRSGPVLTVGKFLPAASPESRTRLKLKDLLLKQKLVRVFASQRLILSPLLALRGGPALLHLGGEPYRPVPAGRNFSKRPHAGRLAYEYYSRGKFDQFARAAQTLGLNFKL